MNKIISIVTIFAVLISYSAAFSKPKLWVDYNKSGDSVVRSVDGKNASSGLFGDVDITQIVNDNPQALEYARLSNDKAKTGKIWFWSWLAVYTVGLGVPVVHLASDTINPVVDFSFLGAALVAALVGGIVSASYFDTSRHYLFKSINTYNGIEQIEKEQSALLYKDFKSNEKISYFSWSYNL